VRSGAKPYAPYEHNLDDDEYDTSHKQPVRPSLKVLYSTIHTYILLFMALESVLTTAYYYRLV
jgi:hypothetical protein